MSFSALTFEAGRLSQLFARLHASSASPHSFDLLAAISPVTTEVAIMAPPVPMRIAGTSGKVLPLPRGAGSRVAASGAGTDSDAEEGAAPAAGVLGWSGAG